ncbi:MAG: hypothetical protein U0X91_20860 [Spirosomataceae bacterium]
MAPVNLTQVEVLMEKRLVGKLWPGGKAACRRIVMDALEALPEKYPYRVQAYLNEKIRLERLLRALGE